MKTALLTTALAIGFLSAGAFASNNKLPAPAAGSAFNVTVIAKNQAWPIRGLGLVGSCQQVRCLDI